MNARLRLCLLVVLAFALHLGLARLRVSSFLSPLHDEPITLLASAATQQAYESSAFGAILPARHWQGLTRVDRAVPYAEIAAGVTAHDKHPPLAFWVFNRWLALLGGGGYGEALWLCHLLVLAAGALTAAAAWLVWRRWTVSAFAAFLFLLGNSAVYTSSYVRQYALLAALTSAHLCLAVALARGGGTRARDAGLAAAMAVLALAGMLTQYLFAVATLPLYAVLLWHLWRSNRLAALSLACFCLVAAVLLHVLFPGVWTHVGFSSGSEAAGHSWPRALAGLPTMLAPWPSSVPLPALAALGAILAAGVAWRALRGPAPESPAARLVLAAALAGPLLLQLPLVASGRFPAWATGAVYLAPLWNACCVLVAGAVTGKRSPRLVRTGLLLLPLLLALAQILFSARNMRNPMPESSRWAEDLRPGLVVIDRPDRGLVLPLVLPFRADQPVLVLNSDDLCSRVQQADVAAFPGVLWLLEGHDLKARRQRTAEVLVGKGWEVKPLVTRHPGAHEAVWLRPPGH